MTARLIHTITREDIGAGAIRKECKCCGRGLTIYLMSVIGSVQPSDLGKHVYDVDGVIQVESDDQRDARLGK